MKIDLNQHQQIECYVVCPYCGYEPDETYPALNGDWEEVECDKCGKKYHASAEVSYSTRKNCKLNGSECDWAELPFMKERNPGATWYHCKNCNRTRITKKEQTGGDKNE